MKNQKIAASTAFVSPHAQTLTPCKNCQQRMHARHAKQTKRILNAYMLRMMGNERWADIQIRKTYLLCVNWVEVKNVHALLNASRLSLIEQQTIFASFLLLFCFPLEFFFLCSGIKFDYYSFHDKLNRNELRWINVLVFASFPSSFALIRRKRSVIRNVM